jgi:hypothetical protein
MRFCNKAAAAFISRQILFWRTLLAAAIMLLPTAAHSEPVPIDGTTYLQDFDTLISSGTGKVESLPLGWTFVESDDRADTVYTAGTGINHTGDTYSFGNTGSSDRALGVLQSHTLFSVFGANFQNKTGNVINEITVQYTGEQWRLGTSDRGADRIEFQYSLDAESLTSGHWINVHSLDFISPVTSGAAGPLNGNDNANRVILTQAINGVSIPADAVFWIRWLDYDVSNSDDGLAVDDFSLSDPRPTYAVVSGFAAHAGSGGETVLDWTTSSETGTVGFRLERLNRKTGKYEEVSGLLPGMLSPPFGGTYRFADSGAAAGEKWTYRLTELTAEGEGMVFGPYDVRAELPPPPMPGLTAHGPEGFASARQAASRRARRRSAARSAAAALKRQFSRTLKAPVERDGLVHLSAEEIAAASGLKKHQTELLLKANKALVTLEGRRIATLAAPDGAGIWFYGQAPARSDIGQNIYRLELGKTGAAVVSAPPAKGRTVSQPWFIDRLRAEENLRPLHFYNLSRPPQDIWAWDYLFAANGKPDELSLSVKTPHPAGSGNALLTVNLVNTGSSGSKTAAPYKVSVVLNGEEAAAGESRMLGGWQLRAQVPAELLREDSNEVRIIAHLNSGITYSLTHLDSIELEYRRKYQAENGSLTFTSGPQQGLVTVRGFSSKTVLALDITDPRRPMQVRVTAARQADGSWAAKVPTQPELRYFLTENISKTVSGALSADLPSRLRDARNQADYLIIAPASMLESALRLADHRESQGLSSMIADIEDVQDEFSWSLAAPEAVRSFLSHVHSKWAQAPRYVALIGDGSIDYKNYLGHGRPQAPAELALTPDGLFPSDNRLADVEGNDGVPEFALGRIPAADSAELNHYIDKIISYEQAAHAGSRTALVLNDRPDLRAGDFRASAARTAALLPEGSQVVRIDAGVLGCAAAAEKTADAMRQGTGILHYIGHSSVTRLGSGSGLLSAAGMEAMSPAGPPLLMASMTCSSGFFGYPPMSSVGEAAVLQPDSGAAAFFGASGLSRNHLADILTEGLYQSLADPAAERIGDAVAAAKRHYADKKQGRDAFMLDIYNLIGDPALLMPERQ